MAFDKKQELGIQEAFRISIILKGLNALLEIALGAVLFFTSRHEDFFLALVQNQLVDDPNDFLGRHASTVMHYLDPKVQLFAALYLVLHGTVKAGLIWGLLKDKLWSYPAALAVFTLFVGYQVFKWLQHHSFPLVFLTVFDVLVMWLIWHEYQRRLKTLKINPAA